MSTTCGSIVGIKPAPEQDGSHMLQVADFGEEPFELVIQPWEVAEIAATLQKGLVARAATTRFPELTVDSVGLAHKETSTALMVSTIEIGHLALVAEPEMLRRLRSEIDRALSFLEGPAGSH